MNKFLRMYRLWLVMFWGSMGIASAQTITTGALPNASVCTGSTISVPFTTSITSGTFTAGNQFTVQLAPAVGTFTNIGTGTSSPITVTIPDGTTGAGYRVRVVSTNPVVNGSVSTTSLTISAIPNAPTTSNITYCQNATATPLVATPSPGATLNWYGTNATGGTASAIAPTPSTSTTGTVTYYVSQSIGACEGPRTGIAVTINSGPQPPSVTIPAPVCQGDPVGTLSATPSAGGILNWYGTNETGGSRSAVAPTPSPTTSANYYVSQTINGCESTRAKITVTINSSPTQPGVTPHSFCKDAPASALTAAVSTGGTLNWYGTDKTGGTASPTAPMPPTSTVGTTTYYVSQTVNGCEGPRAALAVTIKPVPAAPIAIPPMAYCQDIPASALTATVSTGGTLNWYGTDKTGGTASTVATLPATDRAGTTNYYVSQTVNGCEGPRTAIPVTVDPKPVAPTVTASFAYCQGDTAKQLTAVVNSGNTANWYGTSPVGGIKTAVGPIPQTAIAGTTTYYVSQTTAGDCESDRISITVTVHAKPAAPLVSAIAFCQNVIARALTATPSAGGILIWYGTDKTGGIASPTAPTPPTSTTGVSTYYVSQKINGCEGPRASLVVTIKSLPVEPVVGKNLSLCQDAPPVSLMATPSADGTLNWYGTSETGGKGSPIAPAPPTNVSGTFKYYVSQTINECESPRASLTVTIKEKPSIPIVTGIEYCQNGTALPLTATPTGNGVLKWYSTSTDTTSLPKEPTPNTKTPGSTDYYVSQKDGNGCESNRGLIKVTINPTPSAPAVTIDRPEVCQKETPVALTANGSGLKWYATDSTTTPVQNTVQNTDNAGTYVYFVSQTIKACEGPKTRAEIKVKPLPKVPEITSKSEICQDAPVETLAAVGESIKWFESNNSPIGGAPSPSTNVDQPVTYTYKTSQTVNGCESERLTVTYKVNVTPKPTVVTPVSYCQNAAAKPLEATGQNLKWTNPYGSVSSQTPTPPTTNISTKPEGDSYFVTQTSGSCESRKSEIKLIVNAPPTAKIEGVATVNLGNKVPVNISFTSVPPFSYTLSDGTTGTSEKLQQTIELLPTKKTTIYTVTTIRNSCGAGTPVGTFTVNTVVPTVTTSPLSVTTVCVGTTIQVPFTTAGAFTAGNSFRVEIATVADTAFTNKTEIMTGATQSPITAPIPTTLAQGLYRVRVTATNPQVPVPGSSSPTILNIRALPTVTLTGTKDIYDNESTPLSFALTGDAPWTFEYADSLKAVKVTTSTNPHIITVTPVRTITYKVNSVSNSCGVGTAAGTAIIRVLPVLGLEPDPLITAVKVFPVPTENTLTIDIDLPLQKEPATLQLADQNGRVLQHLITRKQKTTLDVSQRGSGVYFLQIQIGNRTTVRKIMKK